MISSSQCIYEGVARIDDNNSESYHFECSRTSTPMLSDEPAIAMCVSTYVSFLGKVNIQMFSELLFSHRNSDGSHTLHGRIAVGLQLVTDFYRAFFTKTHPSCSTFLLLGYFAVHVYSLICSFETGLIPFLQHSTSTSTYILCSKHYKHIYVENKVPYMASRLSTPLLSMVVHQLT